jgi:hypothetical protein
MHQLDEPTGGKAIFEEQKQLVECMCQCRIFNTPGSARDSEAGEGRPHRMRVDLPRPTLPRKLAEGSIADPPCRFARRVMSSCGGDHLELNSSPSEI